VKLISYRTKDHDSKAARYGVLLRAGVVDMRQCMENAPDSINDFVASASSDAGLMATIAARADGAVAVPLDQVELLPCIPRQLPRPRGRRRQQDC
jgi:acylpyruvate hydrolase